MVGGVAALFALMLCYVWADTRQQHLDTWPWLGATLLLNLPGFLIYLVYSAQKTGDWKRAAIPLAYVAESILVGVLVLVPLIYTQALPRQLLMTCPHILPPPGPPPAPAPGQPAQPAPHHPTWSVLTAPLHIPLVVATVVEPPEPPQVGVAQGPWVPGGIPGGPPDGVLNTVIGSVPWGKEPPPPPPPLAHTPPKTQMVRLSSGVVAAKLLYQPKPIYPQLAIMARIQGTVVLQAIIGIDGTVKDLKVLSSHPLLVRAAIDAVKAWRYQPTLLNTEPVEVLTEIDVNFRLGE
jgi:protein TonB